MWSAHRADQEGELAAEMRFEHEFTVKVPLDQAWRALADADAVAAVLPGAQLRAVDGVHTGRIELNPRSDLACEATLSAVDQDDDDHVATVAVHGRQVGGPGIGSAVLRSRLRERDAATTVTLTAEVLTTGHDPGNGFQDAARGIFDAVAEGLERHARERPPESAVAPDAVAPASLVSPTSPGGAPAPAPSPVVAPRGWLERLDPQQRLIAGAAGLVISAAVLRRMLRGRRRF